MTGTYELEIDLNATRNRVWRALTDPEELQAWFCERADVDFAEDRFDFWGRYTPGNPTRGDSRGRVVDLVPAERLQFEWQSQGSTSLVTFTLEGDTTVRVLHESVPSRTSDTGHQPRHLWADAFVHLRGHLERDDSGPRFDYAWPHVGGFRVEANVAAPPEEVWRQLVEQGWQSAANPRRRPPRNADEDFSIDVGELVGIRFLDIEEPSRFVLEWLDPRPTVMTYTLEGSGGRTHVTLVHSGFDADEDVQGQAEGFYSGLVEIAWRIATNGVWPRAVPLVKDGIIQSNGGFGVRVLQSTGR